MVSEPAPASSSAAEGMQRAVHPAGEIRRGSVCWAELPDSREREGASVCPVVVIQNELGNRYGSRVIVAAVTSRLSNGNFPLNVPLEEGLLGKPAEVSAAYIHTIHKARIGKVIASLPAGTMARVDEAVRLSLGLPRCE